MTKVLCLPIFNLKGIIVLISSKKDSVTILIVLGMSEKASVNRSDDDNDDEDEDEDDHGVFRQLVSRNLRNNTELRHLKGPKKDPNCYLK